MTEPANRRPSWGAVTNEEAGAGAAVARAYVTRGRAERLAAVVRLGGSGPRLESCCSLLHNSEHQHPGASQLRQSSGHTTLGPHTQPVDTHPHQPPGCPILGSGKCDFIRRSSTMKSEGRTKISRRKHSVHWFRKGLRLSDNPALLRGIRRCETFRCIFILDPWFAGSSNVGTNKWR